MIAIVLSMDRTPTKAQARWPGALSVLLLLLLPTLLLGECVFGGKAFLPFDVDEYPPAATQLPMASIRELCANSNYDATEAPVWFVPEWRYARESLLQGVYPHWNPYARFGEPISAHGHLGFWDPLHWPMLLFSDPADGLLLLTCLMLAIGGISMYGLLRELGLDRLAATFGGVAFEMSGTMTANAHWYMRLEPLALLPAMLWASIALRSALHPERSAETGGPGRRPAVPFAGLSAAVACAWLSGFPPFCLVVSLLLALSAGFMILLELRRGAGRAARLAVWLLSAGATGLLLASPQILQQIFYYPESARPLDPSLGELSRHAFDPMGLLGYVFPDAFSHPTDASMPDRKSALAWTLSSLRDWETGQRLRPNYNFTEYALFPGTLVLFLALLGALAGFPGRARRRLAAVMALGCCLLLAIAPGPLRQIYRLPFFETIPPQRFTGPACAFVAILAAAGFQRLRAPWSPWILRSLAVLGIAAGAYCLGESTTGIPQGAEDPWAARIAEKYRPIAREFGVLEEQFTPELVRTYFEEEDGRDLLSLSRQRLRWNLQRSGAGLLLGGILLLLVSLRERRRFLSTDLGILVLAFTVVENGAFSFALNRGKQRRVSIETPVHQFLEEQRDASADAGGFTVGRALHAWSMPIGGLVPLRIRDLNFYTFPDRRSTEPFRRLYGADFLAKGLVPGALPDDERLELPFWDAVGLRFLLSPLPLEHGGSRVGPSLSNGEPGRPALLREFYVYERPRALPRAHVVSRLAPVDGDEAALQRILRPDFAPADEVVVTPDQAALLGDPVDPDPHCRERRVHFLLENAKRLTVRVEAGAPGYLVLADTYLRGWTAALEGREIPIARGNYFQRVVALPARACTIEFRYRTPGLREGLLGLALGLLGLVAGLLRARRRI
ncbi:MAG: hypothetical protein Fur0037_03240 [Planctomycetota bacterium]